MALNRQDTLAVPRYKTVGKNGTPTSVCIHFYCRVLRNFSSCRKILNENIENSIIYTDSLSVLTALHPRNAITPLIGDILHNIRKTIRKGHNIKFCWVPSHVGIGGNEKADECAAKARHKKSPKQESLTRTV